MTEIVNINDRRSALATGSSNSISKSLEAALETPMTVNLDGEARPSTWRPPASVSPDLRSEASSLVAQIDRAMELCPQAKSREWLLSLAPLVAANITAEDARVKLDAYVGMLEYPTACFTKPSLHRAAKRFKFFPTYSELTDFLDDQLSEVRIKRQRLQAIVNTAAGQKQIAAPEPQTLEQRQHMGSLFGMLAQAIGSGNFNDVMAAADCRRTADAERNAQPWGAAQ